ncbi:MAG: hypothetical protein Q8P30_03205 [Candidatus Uhrbacteria bacterium]|nr:hypothetical protein [Candidatus Uhrbacteria bacterium]
MVVAIVIVYSIDNTAHYNLTTGDRMTRTNSYGAVLVHVLKESSDTSIESTEPTPFELFLVELLGRYGTLGSTTLGQVTFTAFPAKVAVAHGLYRLASAIANGEGLNINNPSDYERALARVDRLVNAGLALEFDTPQKAVDAFVAEVVRPVNMALLMGLKPSMQLTRGAWTGLAGGYPREAEQEISAQPEEGVGIMSAIVAPLSAQFFGRLVKTARTLGNEVREFYEFYEERCIEFVLDQQVEVLESAEIRSRRLVRATEFLDVSLDFAFRSATLAESICKEVKSILGAHAYMEELGQGLQAFNSLPTNLVSIPEKAFAMCGTSIEATWIGTQVLLAVIDGPDRDYVTLEEYTEAVELLRQGCDQDELSESVLNRIEQRGWKHDRSERDVVLRAVQQSIPRMSKLSLTEIADALLSVVYLLLSEEQVMFNSDTALDVACGGQFKYPPGISNSEKVKFLKDKVASQIDWSRLPTLEMESILSAEVLPRHVIVDFLPACLPYTCELALEWMLERDVDLATMSRLVHHKLVQLTPQFVARFAEVLPVAELKANLPALVRSPSAVSAKLWRSGVITAIGRVDKKTAESVFGALDVRRSLQKNLVAEIRHRDDRAGAGVTNEGFRSFYHQVGKELWYLFVLSIEIDAREESYLNPEIDDVYHAPWNCVGTGEELRRYEELYGLARNALKRLFSTYTEEQVFKWLHEGEADVSERWASYVKAREHYYKVREPDEE